MSLAANLTLALQATAGSSPDVGSGLYTIDEEILLAALTTGSGENQATRIWSDVSGLLTSPAVQIDLKSPQTTDQLGQALAFSKIKALLIRNLTPGDEEPWIRIFSDDGTEGPQWYSAFGLSYEVCIRPGGTLLLIAPDAHGYDVGQSADNRYLELNAEGAALDYQIILIGA
jgi:hypothetical protein